MASKVPTRSKDPIFKGLSECFGVDQNVVRAVYSSQNENMEKTLHILEALSPKVSKTNKNASKGPAKNKTPSGKEKDNSKNKENKNKDKNEPDNVKKNTASSSTTPGKTKVKSKLVSQTSKEDNKDIASNKSENKVPSVPKNKQKNTKTKPETPVASSSADSSETSATKSNDVKKKNRVILKNAYEIIRQKKNAEDRIRDCIKCKIRVIVLMRGCPGSGKSTYARKMLEHVANPEMHIFSTDNYFCDSKGVYVFDKLNLDQAHTWNQSVVLKMMKFGLSPIIVDNTNIKAWEMMAYAQYAVQQGYVIETVQPLTSWFFNASILAKKNTHGVPKSKISDMLEHYEPNLTGDVLLKLYNLEYNVSQLPPQAAIYSEEQAVIAYNKLMLGKQRPVPIQQEKSCKPNNQNQKAKATSSPSVKVTHPDIQVLNQVTLSPKSDSSIYKMNRQTELISFDTGDCEQITESLTGISVNALSPDLLSQTLSQSFSYDPVSDVNEMTGTPLQNPQGHKAVPEALKTSSSDKLLSYSEIYKQHYFGDKSNVEETDAIKSLKHLSNSCRNEGNIVQSTADSVKLDLAEFPSLASRDSIYKSNVSSYEHSVNLNKNREDKIKQIVELFPHLDEGFIRDMCGDTETNLNSVVGSLLDLNICSTSSSEQAKQDNDEPLRNVDESNSGDVSSEDDENEFASNSNPYKDITMLSQLFPNIEEDKLKQTYLSCKSDFREALEELLNYCPSDSVDETSSSNEAKSTVSQSLTDQTDLNSVEADASNISSVDEMWKLLNSYQNQGNYSTNMSTSFLENKNNFALSSSEKVVTNEISNDDVILNNLSNFEKICDDKNLTSFHVNVNESYNENSTISSSAVSELIDNAVGKIDGIGNENVINKSKDEKEPTDQIETKGYQETVPPITLKNVEDAMQNALSSIGNATEASTSFKNCYQSTDKSCFNNTVTDLPQENKPGIWSYLFKWSFSKNDNANPAAKDPTFQTEPKDQRQTFNQSDSGSRHISTNTNYEDFNLLQKAQHSSISEKVLCCTLDFVSCVKPANIVDTPVNVLMLEKGTCTDELETGRVVFSDDTVNLLVAMFPSIPCHDLETLLKDCVGDLNWAVGILLDSGHEISSCFNPSEFNVKYRDSDIIDTSNSPSEIPGPQTEAPLLNQPQTSNAQQSCKIKKRNSRIPIGAENLNFIINDDSISEHVRKIRNNRLGIVECNEDYENPSVSNAAEESFMDWSSEEEGRDEETLAVALSTDFVLALQAQFGGFLPTVLPDNQVLVNLPVEVAQQLHLCIIDSLSKQLEEEQALMNKIIEEDEYLARQLQDMENGVTKKCQNIQDIMDEELALNIHRSLNKSKSNEDTMAGKLTRQLLVERFPTMDPVALKTILDDTDHSLYQATQLLEAAGYKRAATEACPESMSNMVDDTDELSRDEAVEQASAYRNEAKIFFQMRHDCFMKAQEAYSQGDKHVASYYSQMANWHNQRIEQANLLASTLLLSGNKNATTLDLHFLRVCEAIQVLDLFIDAHVSNLMEMKLKKRQVYIITGRGRHSVDGKSKIRPVTMSRLKQRSIEFQIVNPGLLLVHLTANTPLAYKK